MISSDETCFTGVLTIIRILLIKTSPLLLQSQNLASTFSDSGAFKQYTPATNRDSRCTMTESQRFVTVKRRNPFLQTPSLNVSKHQNKNTRVKVLPFICLIWNICQMKKEMRGRICVKAHTELHCLQLHKYLLWCSEDAPVIWSIRNGDFVGKKKTKYKDGAVSLVL